MRRTPYDLAFGADAEPRFAELRDSLARTGRDPADQDAFILDPEVVRYLRELVPEEGIGEAVAEHVALLHHAYRYWAAGGWTFRLTRERAAALLRAASPPLPAEPPPPFYVQFPERLVWAPLAPDAPHQPLDGLFVQPWPAGGCFLLAVFGLHPGQDGFSVVAADGYRPEGGVREDGAPWFAPTMPGGEAAGLHAITSEDELLELAARCTGVAAEGLACAAPGRRPHEVLELGGQG